ncbi:MAG: HlyD family efflux transporter periplasmic adaptor subunit [Chloroflexi bacterium]|nr:HlyD family efflux transporter periplasmic adaptor subunit [Chloroflexota bacterium]
MNRCLKISAGILVLAGLVALSAGCKAETGQAEAIENQIVTVERGDLTVEITAVGNLAFSRSEDLAFDLFYGQSGTSGTKGTIGEVLVAEGDTVEEGQVLVTLDRDEWEDELGKLQDKLTTAERDVTDKERALTKAERKVTTLERTARDREDAVAEAEREVTASELDLSQAQLDVETAEYNLSQIDEVKEAQDAVDEAERNLELARMGLTAEFGGNSASDFIYWNNQKVKAETELAEAQADLQEILTDKGITLAKDVALEVADKQLKVKQKQLTLEDAQLAVGDAEKAVDDAEYALESAKFDVEEAGHDVDDAQLDVKDAQKALADAQKKLTDAQNKSPEIKAPFAGFITKVNVSGGDEVLSGTVAVQLADPNKFEAEIMISEMDIAQVKVGGEASVQVDALSGLTLPAEVTHISPTATISQGVVNYKVKVEVASLEEMIQKQQAAQQEAAQSIQEGELPERLQQAIEEGRITREQAEEMVKQWQQGASTQPGQVAAAALENLRLREGLTVTVNIMVDSRSDVLLVPNAAITSQGGQSYVKVALPDGTFEERTVQTGISNWQFTEVTDGLSEGEQVVVPKGTAVTSTTQQTGPRGGVMMFGPPPGR